MLVQGTIKAHTRLRYLNRVLLVPLCSSFLFFLALSLFNDRTAISRGKPPFCHDRPHFPTANELKKKRTQKGAHQKLNSDLHPSKRLHQLRVDASPPKFGGTSWASLSLRNLQSHTWWTNQNVLYREGGEQTKQRKKTPHTTLTKKALALFCFLPTWRITSL